MFDHIVGRSAGLSADSQKVRHLDNLRHLIERGEHVDTDLNTDRVRCDQRQI